MKIEDGMKGLYVRIVARRIGRGRGREGFGNARDVQNMIAHITERQAKRLKRQRKAGKMPDDNQLTKEDLIGPVPSSVLKNNPTWAKLHKLIGLVSVKQSVQSLFDGIQFNYQRELEEKPIFQYSLNRCLIGSPGTGKTSVGKLYGRLLADIGLLSNGEGVYRLPLLLQNTMRARKDKEVTYDDTRCLLRMRGMGSKSKPYLRRNARFSVATGEFLLFS
jgi:hypothetical protein